MEKFLITFILHLVGTYGFTKENNKNLPKKEKTLHPFITINMRASSAALEPLSLTITVQPDGNARTYISGDFGERISFQAD